MVRALAVALLLLAAMAPAVRAAPVGAPPTAAPAAAPATYFVLVHTPGPAWKSGVGFRDQPGIADHVRYMDAFLARGVLIMAGPFLDNSGGMAIFHTASLEEAQRLANDDPTVKNGLLRVTVRPWLAVMDSRPPPPPAP